jgi:hypothetical protein
MTHVYLINHMAQLRPTECTMLYLKSLTCLVIRHHTCLEMNLCLTRFSHACTLLARYITLFARYDTLFARYDTLLARYDTLLTRHVTLLARYDMLLARYATFLTRYASCTLFWCSNTRWGLYMYRTCTSSIKSYLSDGTSAFRDWLVRLQNGLDMDNWTNVNVESWCVRHHFEMGEHISGTSMTIPLYCL